MLTLTEARSKFNIAEDDMETKIFVIEHADMATAVERATSHITADAQVITYANDLVYIVTKGDCTDPEAQLLQ